MDKIVTLFKKYEFWVFLILSIIVGLTPLLWFNGKPIAGEEYYALDYAQWGKLFSDSWFSSVNFGEYAILQAFKFQRLIFEFFYLLGATKYLALVVWFCLLWVVTSVGFYFFVHKLGRGRTPAVFSFIGSLFYLLSPYFLNISPFLTPPRLVFASLPLLGICALYIHENRANTLKLVFLMNLVIFIFSPAFVNLPTGLTLLIIPLAFLFYEFLVIKFDYKKLLISVIYLLSLFFALNYWWLSPVVSSSSQSVVAIKESAADFTTVDKTKSFDVFSLFGSWAYREKIAESDYYYFPYNLRYDEYPLVFIRFIPFIVVVFLVFRLIQKKDIASVRGPIGFLVLLLAIFLFFSKGVAEPLSFIFGFLYSKFPYFWVFREPYAKFMPIAAFSLSALVYVSMQEIHTLLSDKVHKNKVTVLMVVTALVTVISVGWPFLSKEVVWNVNDDNIRSYVVDIPQAWDEIQSVWKPDVGYYYLFPSMALFDIYDWPSGYRGNPYLMLTNAKLINPDRGYVANEGVTIVANYILGKLLAGPESIIPLLNRYNLSGIILQKDTTYPGFSGYINNIINTFEGYASLKNDNANIYEFTEKPSIFSLVPVNQIRYATDDQISKYNVIRDITGDDYLISFHSEGLSNYNFVDQKTYNAETNSVRFDLGDLPAGPYTMNIMTAFSSPGRISVDDSILPATRTNGKYHSFQLDKTADCCNDITIEMEIPPTTIYSFSAPGFVQLPIFSSDFAEAELVTDSILLPTTGNVYMTRISDFDPAFTHRITLFPEATGDFPIGASIVIVDGESNRTRYLGSFAMKSLRQSTSFVYDHLSAISQIIPTNAEYYIAFYPFKLKDDLQRDVPYPEGSAYKINGVTIERDNTPRLVYEVGVETDSSVENPEFVTLSDSFHIVKTTNTSDAVLHFKNSYNTKWELKRISEYDYNSLSSNPSDKRLISRLSTNEMVQNTHLNLEYYSNGWVIKGDSQPAYWAVVFPATFDSEKLYGVAIWVLFVAGFAHIYGGKFVKKVMKHK